MIHKIVKRGSIGLAILAMAGLILPAGGLAQAETTDEDPPPMAVPLDTVAARLGGFIGIRAFLHDKAVPALLADPEIASFFGHLTETGDDIEQCLAMLLDHDLGGSSPHSGVVLANGHKCRSSMTDIHRGRNIPDRIIDKFIGIVGQEAATAGIAPADIAVVAKVLNRYRGGVRNK